MLRTLITRSGRRKMGLAEKSTRAIAILLAVERLYGDTGALACAPDMAIAAHHGPGQGADAIYRVPTPYIIVVFNLGEERLCQCRLLPVITW
jgi:hypothetical protein